MKHSNSGRRRSSSTNNPSETYKFPDFEQSVPSKDLLETYHEQAAVGGFSARTSSPSTFKNTVANAKWPPLKNSHVAWGKGLVNGAGRGHGRQKSLSDALRTIRTRRGSVSANAHEIADALKAPISIKLIVRYSLLGKDYDSDRSRSSVLSGT